MIVHHNLIVRPVTCALFTASIFVIAAFCSAAEEDSRWVHPLCKPLVIDSNGPFVELADGSLMTIDPQGTRCSQDDGKTWTKPVVLARQKDGQLSYPYCLERRPGELWVIAGFAFKKGWQEPQPLRLKIDEEGFLREAKKGPWQYKILDESRGGARFEHVPRDVDHFKENQSHERRPDAT